MQIKDKASASQDGMEGLGLVPINKTEQQNAIQQLCEYPATIKEANKKKIGLGQFLHQMKLSGSDREHRSTFLLSSPMDQKIVCRDTDASELRTFAVKPHYRQKQGTIDHEERSIPVSKISLNLHSNLKSSSFKGRERLIVDFQYV